MDISINLLPERSNSKEGKPPLIPIAGLAIIATLACLMTYIYIDTRQNVQALEKQLEIKEEARTAIETDYLQLTAGVNKYNYVDQHVALNQFLSTVYQSVSRLKDRVYFLLPEAAKVENFSFTNVGDVSLTVTTYSKGDAAVYLNRLLNEAVVMKAEVQTISIDEREDGDVAYTSQFILKLQTLEGEASE